MATIFNDPAEFTDEAVEGFVDLYSDRLRRVPGGVVRRQRPSEPKVAILVGGGSGHYPAFAGVVGPGFADGAVIGNIFTSPSTVQGYSVGRAAHSGAGVIFTYGNYAGDVMNFGMAGERLQAEGIDARQVIVTDDVASGTAAVVLRSLERMKQSLHEAEDELGRVDAIAGDGDHGRGMVRGIDYAVTAAQDALDAGWGVAGVLSAAGDAWADYAGGTSGVLWGAGLRAFGSEIGNEEAANALSVSKAVDAFVQAMMDLGKAELGDKTIIDAALPFRDALAAGVAEGRSLREAWSSAAVVAEAKAQATSSLRPRKGRARPLAERSLGHPDPGALSFAMCVTVLGEVLDGRAEICVQRANESPGSGRGPMEGTWMTFRIVLVADQAGVSYKDALRDMLEKDDRVSEVIDVGVLRDTDPTAYPHLAVSGARMIAAGEADRGIFICGTGMGMAISANKVAGIRACTAHDSYSVERLVKSNDAQVLCLGERVIGRELALRLASEFLGYAFDTSSPSAEKVDALRSYEVPGDAGA